MTRREAGGHQEGVALFGAQAQLGGAPSHLVGRTRVSDQPLLPTKHRLPADADRTRQLGVADAGSSGVLTQ
jgi:hypothetical protein